MLEIIYVSLLNDLFFIDQCWFSQRIKRFETAEYRCRSARLSVNVYVVPSEG